MVQKYGSLLTVEDAFNCFLLDEVVLKLGPAVEAEK